MDGQTEKLADVIDLNAFRSKVQHSTPDLERVDEPYGGVDYATYHDSLHMLKRLNGNANPGKLVVLSRFVPGDHGRVLSAKDDKGWYYAVDKSVDELDSLTGDLDLYDADTERRLTRPLRRLYVATLIAQNVLRREARVVLHPHIPNPAVGNTVVLLDKGSQERELRVNTWRAAAGLGILAVGRNRPVLQRDMREYLADVVANRLEYAVSFQRAYELLGRDHSETFELSDFLLGVCAPLNRFELKKTLRPNPPDIQQEITP